MKPLTEKEHKIIMENCLALGNKITHPLDLGEAQLKNVIRCMRCLEVEMKEEFASVVSGEEVKHGK